MQNWQKNRLQMFRRVRNFVEAYKEQPSLTGAIAELDGVIERLAQQGTQQDASDRRARAATSDTANRSRELREVFLRPVLLIGRRVIPAGALDVGSSGAALRTPRRRDSEGRSHGRPRGAGVPAPDGTCVQRDRAPVGHPAISGYPVRLQVL